jgi:hypothetical protein
MSGGPEVPDAPGLGIELNDTALARLRLREVVTGPPIGVRADRLRNSPAPKPMLERSGISMPCAESLPPHVRGVPARCGFNSA